MIASSSFRPTRRAGAGGRTALGSVLTAVAFSVVPPVGASAVSVTPADVELRAAAVAADPGSATWALELRRSAGGAVSARVEGRGDVVRVTQRRDGSRTWSVGGSSPLAHLIAGAVPAEVLADAGSPRARWVLVDRNEDRYQLHDEVVTTDPGIRVDQVARWLADGGGVIRAGDGFTGTRPAESLPRALDRLFFDDGTTPVSVTVTVRDGRVVGYRFQQRSMYGDERFLSGHTVGAPRSLTVPARSQVVGLGALEDAVERAASAERFWSSLVLDGTVINHDRLSGLVRPRRDRVPVPEIAPTRTGAVVIPSVRSVTGRLLGARCVDLPSENPVLRDCTAADSAQLTDKFEFYARWLRDLAVRPGLSDEQVFFGLDRLNHALWLYSGLRFEAHELSAWSWFYLDVFVRAQLARNQSRPDGSSHLVAARS